MLIASPYFLEEGDLVVAQIEALNAIGYSTPSTQNTDGAKIIVKPHKPTISPRRGSNTNSS